MTAIQFTTTITPLGELMIAADNEGLRRIVFQEGTRPLEIPAPWVHIPHPDSGSTLRRAVKQITAYFEGRLQEFDLPLAPEGTPFQQRAWKALCQIPYGETWTYGQQARLLGAPTASRAVGAANGRNPLPIVIPCHRVVGSSGKLTGYYGGLHIKEALLELERPSVEAASAQPRFL